MFFLQLGHLYSEFLPVTRILLLQRLDLRLQLLHHQLSADLLDEGFEQQGFEREDEKYDRQRPHDAVVG